MPAFCTIEIVMSTVNANILFELSEQSNNTIWTRILRLSKILMIQLLHTLEASCRSRTACMWQLLISFSSHDGLLPGF